MKTPQEMICFLLDDTGIKQDKLAHALEVSQPTISRIAKGASTHYETGKKIEVLYEHHRGHEIQLPEEERQGLLNRISLKMDISTPECTR